jgi:hypothetical protein
MKTYSYQEIANDFRLWQTYADPEGLDTEEEFNNASEGAKITFLTQCFGPERKLDS